MKVLDPYTKKRLSAITSTIYMLRNERGWSQRALAEKSKVNYTTIAKVEIGEQCYSLPTLLQFSKVFQMTLAQIFERANL